MIILPRKISWILFRLDNYPVLVINDVTGNEAKNRGLWIKHPPLENIIVGGVQWKKYIYEHHDGPYNMRTIAFVTEYQGKWLGVEFSNSGELDSVH